MVAVENLRKYYGKKQALQGVSFEVYPGEVFTIVGPNGSGKTTIMEIMEGIRKYSSGRFSILGGNPGEQAIKEKIGVQLQDSQPMNNLSCREAVQLFRSFYKKGAVPDKVLGLVGLAEKQDSLVRKLSGGQKKRLEIALAIINDPEVVFLDEPTTGLDPNARRQIWKIIKNLREMGKSVLFTTHYMDEAETLSDRVAILYEGRIVALDSPKRLIFDSGLKKRVVFSCSSCANGLLTELEEAFPYIRNQLGTISIPSFHVKQDLSTIFSIAEAHTIEVEELSIELPTLEDVFLQKTGSYYPDYPKEGITV